MVEPVRVAVRVAVRDAAAGGGLYKADDRLQRVMQTLADYSAGSACYAEAYASAWHAAQGVYTKDILGFYAARTAAWAARAMDLYSVGLHEQAREVAVLAHNCANSAHKCADSAW